MLRISSTIVARRHARCVTTRSVQISSAHVNPSQTALIVAFSDGLRGVYDAVWLRDHCPVSFHPTSHQRQVNTFDIPSDLKIQSAVVDGPSVAVSWDAAVDDCARGAFPAAFLHACAWRDGASTSDAESVRLPPGMVPWTRPPTAPEPRHAADAFLCDDSALAAAMGDLHRDGFVLLSGAPPAEDATRALAERIGFVRRTLYGEMWGTAPPADADEAIIDTAYTCAELRPHTDGTYFRDPPGLQLFNCVAGADSGGATWLVDGFAVARRLAKEAPEAFAVLRSAGLRWHHTDEEGTEVGTVAPVFSLVPAAGDGAAAPTIDQFRWNNDDRAAVTGPPQHVERVYRAMRALASIVLDPEMACETTLAPGTVLIVNNHRVMHGRRAFVGGQRNLVGCYIGRDEYEGCLRRTGVLPSQRVFVPNGYPSDL